MPPAESSDYSLVGIAQFNGISYASLIAKQNQEYFLLTTDKPARGLTLVSISQEYNASDVMAVVRKDGRLVTLKWEQPPLLASATIVPFADVHPGMYSFHPGGDTGGGRQGGPPAGK